MLEPAHMILALTPTGNCYPIADSIDPTTKPTVYSLFQDARHQARQLATANPGYEFLIMERKATISGVGQKTLTERERKELTIDDIIPPAGLPGGAQS